MPHRNRRKHHTGAVDARDRAVARVRDPERARAGRDAARALAGLDRRENPAAARVDARDEPERARHPDRAVRGGELARVGAAQRERLTHVRHVDERLKLLVDAAEATGAGRDPDAATRGEHSAGRLADRERPHDAVRGAVHAHQRPVLVVLDPDGRTGHGHAGRVCADGDLGHDRARGRVDLCERVRGDGGEPGGGLATRQREAGAGHRGEQHRRPCDQRGHGAPGRRAPRPRRRTQLRVVREDLPLELAELRPRLEAELVIEPRARAAVRLECLGLPAAAVEREHQLPV